MVFLPEDRVAIKIPWGSCQKKEKKSDGSTLVILMMEKVEGR